MSGMLHFAPWSLCRLEPMDKEGFTKIWGTNLGSRLGVLRPRALILHMTLWTKLKITERTPNCFHFPVHPTSHILRKEWARAALGLRKRHLRAGGHEGVVTAAALPCNSYLISLPSLPSPLPPTPLSLCQSLTSTLVRITSAERLVSTYHFCLSSCYSQNKLRFSCAFFSIMCCLVLVIL
jgi:hypothetical protein